MTVVSVEFGLVIHWIAAIVAAGASMTIGTSADGLDMSSIGANMPSASVAMNGVSPGCSSPVGDGNDASDGIARIPAPARRLLIVANRYFDNSSSSRRIGNAARVGLSEE